VWPKKPIRNKISKVKILYCCIAMAPITGEIPVRTALNDLANFRYSRIIIFTHENKIAFKNIE
jgi:hypothetical protein